MEQSTQNSTCPFLCLPPLIPLPLFLIGRKGVGRDTKIQDLEEQATPRHEALRALLMRRQIQYDRVFIRLEDEVQDYRNFLFGASRRGVEQAGGKGDQGSEHLLDDGRQDIALLAKSRSAERKVKSQLAIGRNHAKGENTPKCADHLEHDYGARTDLTNVTASEEGLGAVKQFRPFLREVIRDERLEGARKLNSDRTGRRRGKERDDVALQSRAVSGRNRPVIGP